MAVFEFGAGLAFGVDGDGDQAVVGHGAESAVGVVRAHGAAKVVVSGCSPVDRGTCKVRARTALAAALGVVFGVGVNRPGAVKAQRGGAHGALEFVEVRGGGGGAGALP